MCTCKGQKWVSMCGCDTQALSFDSPTQQRDSATHIAGPLFCNSHSFSVYRYVYIKEVRELSITGKLILSEMRKRATYFLYSKKRDTVELPCSSPVRKGGWKDGGGLREKNMDSINLPFADSRLLL